MKKIISKIKENSKMILAFMLGALIFGGMGTVLAATIAASNVTYTSNSQSTVSGALDTLFTKANTWINPNDFGIQRNTAKNVMATPGGVCIKKDNVVYCFGANNWNVEKGHIIQVFSADNCYSTPTYVECGDSNFKCYVMSDGSVRCDAQSNTSYCLVSSSGSITCSSLF